MTGLLVHSWCPAAIAIPAILHYELRCCQGCKKGRDALSSGTSAQLSQPGFEHFCQRCQSHCCPQVTEGPVEDLLNFVHDMLPSASGVDGLEQQ